MSALLPPAIHFPSAAAEDACYRKRHKYETLEQHFYFFSVAVRTMGGLAVDTM